MFKQLQDINAKPQPFQFYTAAELWTDPYRAEQMLAYHLNDAIEASSRNSQFIERSCAWIVEHFSLDSSKKVADFGCGPGLYSSRLALTGAQVTGIDFSANSIRYAESKAQQAGLSIDYVCADYLNYQPGQSYDLICMIFCDFCALSPEQRALLLAKFYDSLGVGGALLFDVYSPAAFERREEISSVERNQLNHFWCAEEYYCFFNTHKYEAEQVVLDKYVVYPEQGEAFTVYNWLQYFSVEAISQELSAAGFRLEKVYANVAGDPYNSDSSEFAIVARKPA